MHPHPDARVRVEKGTADGVKQEGTSVLGDPEDISQRMEDFRKGTDTMERKGLEIVDWTKGHLDCRAGREEKSKPGAERSRDMVEKTGKVEDLIGTGLKGQDRASVTTLLEPGTWTMSLVNLEM